MAAAPSAAAEPPVKPLQGAMKLAKAALELDAADRPREAYVDYLKSISYITQVLLEEAAATTGDENDLAPDTPKMLKVAEQCLERAKSSVSKIGKAKAKLVGKKVGPAPVSRHRRVSSDEGRKLSPFLPPEMFQKLQITQVHSPRNRELSPLEEASLQNQKLRATYEARLARLNPNQAVQKTSLTLSLQRQMMENLVIAKAREEALQRKMEEHRLRLQEAANRRFSSNAVLTPEEQEQRAIYAAILEYEQDHDWPRLWKAQLKDHPSDLSLVPKLLSHLLSFADHPICQLLKKLQCSAYNRIYPLISQSRTDASRGWSLSSSLDAEVFLPSATEGRRLRSSQSLHSMYSVQEHNKLNLRHSISGTPFIEDQSLLLPPQEGRVSPPLADRESSFEDLEQFLSASEARPAGSLQSPLAGKKGSQKEALKAVVKDIHNSIDRLLSLTLLAFEGLNTAAAKDQCLARLEEAFFGPLWRPLLTVYRTVYKAQEEALSKSMELRRKTSPTEMGIPSKLLPKAEGPPPYAAAVQELLLLPPSSCPQRKLECIVRTLRVICECAEEYCGSQRPPASAAIGADDLLPILSFVVLQSNLPQLVSECAALEEFIHEGYLIGEEGYCLTSLQSALSYVQSLEGPLQGPVVLRK
ncbi:VPS9 domain-containing protein 1 isoform X2 [Pantherophis guttatus]|uniref:VPS9 domain-containing protein 1 isoform X2 n=2 Tax=Pantherophis guttatus TaxID=94885 RepID=A0A6P9CGW8_PANGU|nr:VPS9 domain-containing protein 1 isoform X2 [Pantherophis guttatus]